MREASEETALEFEVAVHEVVVHNPKLEQGSSILSWSAKDRVSKPLIFGGSCEVIEDITKVTKLESERIAKQKADAEKQVYIQESIWTQYRTTHPSWRRVGKRGISGWRGLMVMVGV